METLKESSWLGTIWKTSRKTLILEPETPVIGILSFEVSKLMLKIASLWQCLNGNHISRLRLEITNSLGIRKLVSDNQDYLMDLALSEIIDNVRFIAKSVARFGKKSVDPIYHNLDNVFENPFEIDLKWCGWEYRFKKMEKRVKKMKRFAAVTSQLYEELEVLYELENSLKRMQSNNVNQMKLHEFHDRVMWQRQEVRGLREMSTWVRTYDYIVRLLIRSLFTIVERIKIVFGIKCQMGSREGSDFPDSSYFLSSNSISALAVHPSESSNFGDKRIKKVQCRKYPLVKSKSLAHRGPFKRCMTFEIESPGFASSSSLMGNLVKPFLKLKNAQKSNLGDAALDLHYANIIIYIDKLATSPHLINLDAREDLYDMLTTRIKNSLRYFLKNEASSVYNNGIASNWSSSMEKTLDWLVPLANNTRKWHSERNFDNQNMGSGGNVLLVKTLYYADQEKTENAITELLMGLHYISRFGEEIHECDDYLVHERKIASMTLD